MPPTGLSGNTMPLDPANRLVASELESALEQALVTRRRSRARSPCMMRRRRTALLIQLRSAYWPSNLKTVWMRRRRMLALKKRIVRTLVHEVVADIDDAASEDSFSSSTGVGGATASCAWPKRRRGQRNKNFRRYYPRPCVQLVLIASDDLICWHPQRNGLKTGTAIAGPRARHIQCARATTSRC